jgi:hypothetical protein
MIEILNNSHYRELTHNIVMRCSPHSVETTPEILSDDLRCNIRDNLYLDIYNELNEFNSLIFFLLPTL